MRVRRAGCEPKYAKRRGHKETEPGRRHAAQHSHHRTPTATRNGAPVSDNSLQWVDCADAAAQPAIALPSYQ